jgi:hypothetical protein
MTDELEQYEALAKEFESDTGFMAPGKDIAPEMGYYNELDVRRKLWKCWQAKRKAEAVVEKQRRVISAVKRMLSRQNCRFTQTEIIDKVLKIITDAEEG